MEKSKTELYLERLEKWKEQKKKEKEEKMKNKPRPCVSRPCTTAAVKPFMNARTSIKLTRTTGSSETKSTASTKNRASILSASVSTSSAKPVHKVNSKGMKKRKSAETRQLLEKLNKWREEKKSEKKQIQRSAVKPQSTSKVEDRPRYKEVKSRLFDYQTKPKLHSTQKDKENVNTYAGGKTVSMSKTAANKSEGIKTGMKRRHSEIQKSRTHSKPVGILKRKSCFGSFDLNDEGSPSVKKRRTIAATTKTDAITKECSVVSDLDKKNMPGSADVSKAQLPTAVVTPGVSRNVRFTTPPNSQLESVGRKLRKTPKTPATRSKELSDWLKAKGRTPSKFRHLMCFHGEHGEDSSQDPHTKNTLSIDELSEQMDVLEQERHQVEAEERMHAMLDECMILFEAGCPMESIVPWLDDIYKKISCSKTSARFYTCKASVIKYSLDLDAVLEVFEQATINNAQPKEEIARCLTETLKYVTEEKVKQAKKRCHTPSRKQVQEENVFESTAVVYSVSNVTPFSDRKKSSAKKTCGPTQCQVVTPVRRSTRRSLQNLPESLKDKKKSFSSLDEIKGEDILFQPNLALSDVFDTEEES